MSFKAYIESVLRLAPLRDCRTPHAGFTEPAAECRYPVSHLRPLDTTQPIDWQAFESVARWMRNPNRKPWLILHGPSRAGKTRAAVMAGVCLYDGRPFESSDGYRFTRAVDFARIVSGAKGSAAALEHTAFPNPDHDPDIEDPDETEGPFFWDGVIFDDLDKATFSDAVLRNIFDLVDHAEQNERPLIITTQATGPALFNTMMGGEATPQRRALVESIIGRLIDHAEIIGFTNQRGGES